MANQQFDLETLISAMSQGLDKQASDGSDEGASKKEDGEKEDPKKDDKDPKEDKGSEEKKDGDESGDEGQTKSASELGAELARKVLEKTASMTPQNKNIKAGSELAQRLLKQAGVGDVTTADGVSGGVVPNKTQVDTAAMVAEHDEATRPMPTSDDNGPTGSVNEIYDSLIADSLADGAASTDQVHEQGVAAREGDVEDHAVPNQVKVAAVADLISQGVDFESAVAEIQKQASIMEDQFEKAAAVDALVAEGVDFGDAVELVKMAAEEIAFEEDQLMKAAAFEELTAHGVDFDTAVEMIKQASAGDVTTADGVSGGVVPNKTQVDTASMVAEHDEATRPMPTSDGNGPTGSVNEIYDALIADSLADGAASTDQVHDTGVSKEEGNAMDATPNQVKVAALNEMVAEGLSFDEAVAAIEKQAAAGRAFIDAAKAAGGLAAASGRLAGRAVKHAGKKVAAGAASAGREFAGAAGAMANPGAYAASGLSKREVRMAAAKSLAKNPITIGAGVGAAGAAGALALGHKKKAAVDMLVEGHGLNFDDAVALVNAKSQELFGR